MGADDIAARLQNLADEVNIRLRRLADEMDEDYASGAVGLGDPDLLREAATEIEGLRSALDDAQWEAMGEDL